MMHGESWLIGGPSGSLSPPGSFFDTGRDVHPRPHPRHEQKLVDYKVELKLIYHTRFHESESSLGNPTFRKRPQIKIRHHVLRLLAEL